MFEISERRACSIVQADRKMVRYRSCPKPWCSFGGVITAISGWAGSGQAATAGRLTRASSLSGAKLSSGM